MKIISYKLTLFSFMHNSRHILKIATIISVSVLCTLIQLNLEQRGNKISYFKFFSHFDKPYRCIRNIPLLYECGCKKSAYRIHSCSKCIAWYVYAKLWSGYEDIPPRIKNKSPYHPRTQKLSEKIRRLNIDVENACIMSSTDSDRYKRQGPIASRYKYYIIKRYVPQISKLSHIPCCSATDMRLLAIALEHTAELEERRVETVLAKRLFTVKEQRKYFGPEVWKKFFE